MKLYAVKTEFVKVGDNLVEVILKTLNKQKLSLKDNDILVLASKIVAHVQGCIVELGRVKPSKKAVELAKKFSLQNELAELTLREADKIYGGVERAILTLKNRVMTVNAGIDSKNAPLGYVTMWPRDVKETAKKVREEIQHKTGKKIAVMIIDSGLVPLIKGTVGLALAVAGFKPVKDYRGRKDLYGKRIFITQHAVAEDLASAAHLLMGEAAEKIPIVLIREAPVNFDDGVYGTEDLTLPIGECVFMSALSDDS